MEYKRYGKNEDLYRANATEDEPTLKIIMEGTYKERHFVIGAHRLGNPNAYLEAEKEDVIYQEAKEFGKNYDGGLSLVHGGSTYFGKAYWDKSDDKTYVGWDYGHADDYCAHSPKFEGKKWELIDILMDIASAETEINMMNDDDPTYYARLYRQ